MISGINMDLIKMLNRIKKEQFLTQKELAEKLKISQSTLSMWINNKRKPSIKYQKRLLSLINKYRGK